MKNYLEIDRKIFLKNFKKIHDDFGHILKNYIKNPNDENIHDIRVTIRRLEMAYRVLPKKIRRKEKTINYVKLAKMLFKSNARIRDFDIICSKMESKYHEQTPDLVESIKKYRIEKLQNANEIALKIFHLGTPKVFYKTIKNSKLNNRYFDILGKIELSIQKNTIIALGDEKRIDELHILRKDFKKLRYLLELSSNKEKTIQILKNLKEIQDLLGDIHDSDIIIEYLRNLAQNSKYSEIIECEVSERSKKYQAFVASFNNKRPKRGYLQL